MRGRSPARRPCGTTDASRVVLRHALASSCIKPRLNCASASPARRPCGTTRRLRVVLRHALALWHTSRRGCSVRRRCPARRPCGTTDGLRVVLRHAPAPSYIKPRLYCASASPARRPCGTSGRLRVVLRHALALFVHRAEVDLRTGVSLVGGLAVPQDGLRKVLRHALELRGHDTHYLISPRRFVRFGILQCVSCPRNLDFGLWTLANLDGARECALCRAKG